MGVLKAIGEAAAALSLTAALISGCGTAGKIRELREGEVSAGLRLPERESSLREYDLTRPHRDTLRVDDGEGGQFFLMKAVRDIDGEMVASDVLDAAFVTATFRNVAERHGKVDLEFQVVVPQALQESRWQIRLWPDMFILGDSLRLDGIVVTGRDYRRAQLKGYQQYERFLSTIVNDPDRFIDLRQLELFLRRNIPALYAMRTDSTEVSDEQFASIYGTTEQEAVEHYTNRVAVMLNERRKARREKMYRRYVKAPIVTEGLRLDTVMRAVNGDFIYNYIQTVATRPQLRKVDIVLSGGIWESDRKVYDIPARDPLTFYISSISTLVDPTERYLQKVIERRADASTACYVEFALGRSDVDLSLGHNRTETGRIRENLGALLQDEVYDLDSIVVTATCSPEGALGFNDRLSRRRSEGVTDYFRGWMRTYADSLRNERDVSLSLGEGEVRPEDRNAGDIRFIPRNMPENWEGLDALVRSDSLMTAAEKETYFRIREVRDPDARERELSREPFYRRMRESLYPYLRTVRFDFHLHRKGMVKDTVHTTELDTLYMKGVQLIRDRDYRKALEILRPYRDYNTAVAYSLLDYNASAMDILAPMERTARVDYLLAILYSRKGEDGPAVRHYLDACRKEPSYRHRGNLDPEISALIRAYDLNKEEESW